MEKFTYFWKVSEPLGELSNWYLTHFTIDEVNYLCVEQYMMRKKAELFPNNEDIVKRIMDATNPREMRELGRQVKNYDDNLWAAKRENVVYTACWAKFNQRGHCKRILLSTAPNTLVEASPTDTVWGIGLEARNPLAKDRATWRGSNLLGKILTDVRDNMGINSDN